MNPDQFLENYKNELLTYSEKVPYRTSFRGSKLPFCETDLFLFSLCENQPNESMGHMSLWALSLGTAAHKVIQDITGKIGLLFGHWVCESCNSIRTLKLGPQVCCNKNMAYKELEVEEPITGFRGFCDGLLQYNDGYMVIEFKTTSIRSLYSIHEPKLSHQLQAGAYCYLLSRPPYEFKIYGRVFMYTSRDTLSNAKLFYLPAPEDTDFEVQLKSYFNFKKVLQTGEVKNLKMICSAPDWEPYCPWRFICSSPDKNSILEGKWKDAKN